MSTTQKQVFTLLKSGTFILLTLSLLSCAPKNSTKTELTPDPNKEYIEQLPPDLYTYSDMVYYDNDGNPVPMTEEHLGDVPGIYDLMCQCWSPEEYLSSRSNLQREIDQINEKFKGTSLPASKATPLIEIVSTNQFIEYGSWTVRVNFDHNVYKNEKDIVALLLPLRKALKSIEGFDTLSPKLLPPPGKTLMDFMIDGLP